MRVNLSSIILPCNAINVEYINMVHFAQPTLKCWQNCGAMDAYDLL